MTKEDIVGLNNKVHMNLGDPYSLGKVSSGEKSSVLEDITNSRTRIVSWARCDPNVSQGESNCIASTLEIFIY